MRIWCAFCVLGCFHVCSGVTSFYGTYIGTIAAQFKPSLYYVSVWSGFWFGVGMSA